MISELLYNGIDLVIGIILVVLYYLNVPFVVDYIFEIFIAVFAVRYFMGTSSSIQTSCSSRNATKRMAFFPRGLLIEDRTLTVPECLKCLRSQR